MWWPFDQTVELHRAARGTHNVVVVVVCFACEKKIGDPLREWPKLHLYEGILGHSTTTIAADL